MAEKKLVRSHRDLEVYGLAFEAAMEVYEVSKGFPVEERYSLTDQIRRFSRSVAANLAEGWRKRRYGPAFVARLNDAEAEAAETQTWLEFAVRCGDLEAEIGRAIYRPYDAIIGKLVRMITNPTPWLLERRKTPTIRERRGTAG